MISSFSSLFSKLMESSYQSFSAAHSESSYFVVCIFHILSTPPQCVFPFFNYYCLKNANKYKHYNNCYKHTARKIISKFSFMNTEHSPNSRGKGRWSYFTLPLPATTELDLGSQFCTKFFFFLTLAHVTTTMLLHEICPLLDIRTGFESITNYLNSNISNKTAKLVSPI